MAKSKILVENNTLEEKLAEEDRVPAPRKRGRPRKVKSEELGEIQAVEAETEESKPNQIDDTSLENLEDFLNNDSGTKIIP